MKTIFDYINKKGELYSADVSSPLSNILFLDALRVLGLDIIGIDSPTIEERINYLFGEGTKTTYVLNTISEDGILCKVTYDYFGYKVYNFNIESFPNQKRDVFYTSMCGIICNGYGLRNVKKFKYKF